MVTKDQLLENLVQTRKEWEALLAEVGRERMETPGVEGGWSIKDIIAHIAAYERWTSERLDEGQGRVIPPDKEMDAAPDMDARNAIIYRRNSGRDLDDVLAEAHQVYNYLADQLRDLPEEGFQDPSAIGLDSEWFPRPWEFFSENTYKHYEDHASHVRNWLNSL